MGRFPSPERRNENVMIEKATKELAKNTIDPIERLRYLCLQRGVDGIIEFGKMFRRMDKNRSGVLSREEFVLGLRETGLDCINNHDVAELFKHFDRDHNGVVNYDEFLAAIRPPLNENRLKIINMAFDKMDVNDDGQITIVDLKSKYNVKSHPSYMNGIFSSDEIKKHYLSKFENNGSIDGVLTRDEFIDYYAGVSASIDDDVYFDLMLRSAWKL